MLVNNQHLLQFTGAIRLDGQRVICHLFLSSSPITYTTFGVNFWGIFEVAVGDVEVVGQCAATGGSRFQLLCNDLRELPHVAAFSADSISAIQYA